MAKINITGELDCKTTEGKLVDASQVKDGSRENKSQRDINDFFELSIEDEETRAKQAESDLGTAVSVEDFKTSAVVANTGLFYKSVNGVFFPGGTNGHASYKIAIGDMPKGNYDILIQLTNDIPKDLYARFIDSDGNTEGLSYIGDITSTNTEQAKDRIERNLTIPVDYNDIYISLSTSHGSQIAGMPISVIVIQRKNIIETITTEITRAQQTETALSDTITKEITRAQEVEAALYEDVNSLSSSASVASAIAKATLNELGGEADIIETIYIPHDATGSMIRYLPLEVVAGKKYGVNITLSRAIKEGSELGLKFVNNEQDEKSVWLPTLHAGTETFTSDAISLDSFNTDTAYLRISTGASSKFAGCTITVIVADYDGVFADGRLNKLEEIVGKLKLDSIKTKMVLDELGGKIDAIDNWTVVPTVNENNSYSTAHLTPVKLKEGATYNVTINFSEPVPTGSELIIKFVDSEGNVTKWGKTRTGDGLTSVFYMFDTPQTIDNKVASNTTHFLIQYSSLKLQGYDITVILAEGEGVFSNGRLNALENEVDAIKNRVDGLAISKKSIKVLCIGNSFTQDAMGYVPYIMRNVAPHVDLTLGIAYNGGAPLAWHFANLIGENVTIGNSTYKPTTYQMYSKSVNGGEWVTIIGDITVTPNTGKTIDEILVDEDWDIITFQQNGGTSGQDYDTYYVPFINPILKEVSSRVVKPVKFGWLSIHGAYCTTAEATLGHYNRTVENTKKVVNDTSIDVVFPYGTAVQNLRTLADLNAMGNYVYGFMQADDGHLQNGIGCLCASYACTLKLLEIIGEARGIMGDNLIVDNTFMKDNNIPGPNPKADEDTGDYAVLGMTDRNRYLAQVAAVHALKKPYEVTDINSCDV